MIKKVDLFQQQAPLKERLEEKNKVKINKIRMENSSAKIGQFIRRNVRFEQTRKQTAFKNNVISLTIKPSKLGSALTTDIPAFVARSYLQARKQIPRNIAFQLWASCEYEYLDHSTNEIVKIKPVTTKKYTITTTNNELQKFFKDFLERITSNYGNIFLETMKFEYHFIIIPSGGAASTNRDTNSILNKSSVLQIKNDDNNCFWYAIACLMNPTNRAIRDSRNTKAREKVARELCNRCNMSWGKPVALTQLEYIENILECNLYVFSLNEIPILKSSINIWNSLIFKSISKDKNKYFLLYDDAEQHFDCVINITGFLACKKFCCNCLE